MAMSKPVETPKEDIRTRVTRVETRLDAILQFVATKEDLAKLEGKMDARFAEQDRKMAVGFAEQAVAREEAQNRMLKTLIGTACTLAATNAAVVAFLLRVM